MREKQRIQRIVTNYDKQIEQHRTRVEAAKRQLAPYVAKVSAYEKGPQTT